MSSILGMFGGGVSAVGDLYTGQVTANSLNAQADLNTQNAQLATEQGEYDSMKQGMVVSQKLGAMQAGYGASGVSSTSGSVMDVLQASAMNGEMDVQNIQHQAAVKAVNYQNQASLERLGASQGQTASYINAFASVLGSGATAFGQSPSGSGNGGGASDDSESDDSESAAEDAVI